jgi:hypothetical protein
MADNYVIFAGDDVNGLARLGIARLMVELSSAGMALREIGFDGNGEVVYRFPGQGRFGRRGLFDNAVVSTSQLISDLSLEEFNKSFEAVSPAQD